MVKPVIDLPAVLDTDPEPRYRPTDRLAEAVELAFGGADGTGGDVFPHSPTPAARCDLDHDLPWPHGPTALANLSPKSRYHHRVKTFGGWRCERIGPLQHLWTSPTGRRYLVDPTGTRRLPHEGGPAP